LIAISFIVRLGQSIKQIISPQYGDESISKWLRYCLVKLGLIGTNEDQEVTVSDNLAITVSLQLI